MGLGVRVRGVRVCKGANMHVETLIGFRFLYAEATEFSNTFPKYDLEPHLGFESKRGQKWQKHKICTAQWISACIPLKSQRHLLLPASECCAEHVCLEQFGSKGPSWC